VDVVEKTKVEIRAMGTLTRGIINGSLKSALFIFNLYHSILPLWLYGYFTACALKSVAKLPRETNLISSTKTERFSSPVLGYMIHVETRMHFMLILHFRLRHVGESFL
jgi:hypothetical protein